MIKNKKLLGLIPARGGSKRIHDKNVLDFCGEPLIVHTIRAGLNSSFIDRLVVTTEDDNIAEISKRYGADVPFKRPKALSSDSATSIDVVKHSIVTLREAGDEYDYVILLQPTSPLRSECHINYAVQLLIDKKADSILSVCEVDHPVECANSLSRDGLLDGFLSSGLEHKPSQNYAKKYIPNGAIYLVKVKDIIENNTLIAPRNGYAYIMDREDSIDIDVNLDFRFAEFIFKNRKSN